MEHIELLLRLKGAEITYQEFNRPSGYTGRIIHMHDANEICFIASRSECLLFSGGNRRTISGPAILFHRAGSYHELLSVDEHSAPYEGKVIYFRHENLPPALLPGFILDHDCLILPLAHANEVMPYFDLVKTETGQLRMLALLMVLSYIAQHEKKLLRLNAVDSYIFQVIRTISDHLSEPMTLHRLATLFHISDSKLKQDFFATTGTTVKRFTTQLRIRQAATLLQTTRLEIADIAYQCGFSGESHFIETFRTHMGITPAKFRKRGTNHV